MSYNCPLRKINTLEKREADSLPYNNTIVKIVGEDIILPPSYLREKADSRGRLSLQTFNDFSTKKT